MSWSVSAVGKAAAVAKALESQFSASTCSEPEQTIKTQTADTIAKALAAFPAESAVRVSASGSQSPQSDGTFTNSLKVEIEPIWNFVS